MTFSGSLSRLRKGEGEGESQGDYQLCSTKFIRTEAICAESLSRVGSYY